MAQTWVSGLPEDLQGFFARTVETSASAPLTDQDDPASLLETLQKRIVPEVLPCTEEATGSQEQPTGKQLAFTKEEVAQVERAFNAVCGSGDDRPAVAVCWLPKYGCALLQTNSIGFHAEKTTTLQVLAADGYEFYTHTQRNSGNVTFKSCPQGMPRVLDAGDVPTSSLPAVMGTFHKALEEAAAKENKRQVPRRGDVKKHHRTPGFVHAVLHSVVNSHDERSFNAGVDHGGFTDVGHHTGCSRPATSWPLVLALIRHFIVSPTLVDADCCTTRPSPPPPADAAEHIADRFDAFVHLWCLQQLVNACVASDDMKQPKLSTAPIAPPPALHPDVVNTVFELAQTVAQKGSALATNQAAMQHTPSYRDSIDCLLTTHDETMNKFTTFVNDQWEANARQWRLPAPTTRTDATRTSAKRWRDCKQALAHPQLDTPAPIPNRNTEPPSLQELRQQANNNINSFSLPPLMDHQQAQPLQHRVQELHHWLPSMPDTPSEHNMAHFLSALAETEYLFFELIEAYLTPPGNDVDVSPSAPCNLNSKHATRLAEIVQRYLSISTSVSDRISKLKSRAKMATPRLLTELDSLRVLLSWALPCLVYRIADAAMPELKMLEDFRLPLDRRQLQFLVLTERRAVDALLTLSAFLDRHADVTNTRGARSQHLLFTHLDKFRGTEALAGRFCDEYGQKGSPLHGTPLSIDKIWQQEHEKELALRQEYGEKVDAKKAEVARLDREIAELTSEIDRLQRQMSGREYTTRYRSDLRNDDEYQGWKETKSQKEFQKQRRESELKGALKPPDAICFALPRNEADARKALFFNFMPKCLHLLFGTIINALQQLSPKKADLVSPAIKKRLPQLEEYHSYFNSYKRRKHSTTPDATPPRVTFGPLQIHLTYGWRGKEEFETLSDRGQAPGTVRSYPHTSDRSGAYDCKGLVHVDGITLSQNTCVNAAEPEELMKRFTYHSIKAMTKLSKRQWLLQLDSSTTTDLKRDPHACRSSSRGYNALNRSHIDKPSTMSHQAFLQLGGLRAFPRQQLRQLCIALTENRLSLDDVLVQHVVRQLMYEVGGIERSDVASEGHSGMCLTWKRDFFVGDLRDVLAAKLQAYAESIELSPRRFKELRLLGELAAFVASYDTDDGCETQASSDSATCMDTVRHFARAATRWAEQLRVKMENIRQAGAAVTEQERAEEKLQLRDMGVRRCLMLQLALLCYAGGHLTQEDVKTMCKLIVLIKAARPTHKGGESSQSPGQSKLGASVEQLELEEARLWEACLNVTARRLGSIFRHLVEPATSEPAISDITDGGHHCLTAAVQAIFTSAPCGLRWEFEHNTACFHASYERDGAPHLYSINVVTGEVLYDGLPPQRLPETMVNDEIYKRVFGERNFVVVRSGASMFETTDVINHRLYVFHQNPRDHALAAVEEVREDEFHLSKEEQRWTLELVPATADLTSQLPVCLQQLHTAWYCRAQGVLVLRNHFFLDKAVYFILVRNSEPTEDTATCPWTCFRIPANKRLTPWHELFDGISAGGCDNSIVSSSSGNSGSGSSGSASFDRLMHVSSKPPDADANDNNDGGGTAEAILRALAKFEDRQYIHVLHQPSQNDAVVFELPRFRLSFKLDKNTGELDSCDYKHYRLARQQLWHDTLRGFVRYLVLELDEEAVAKDGGLVHTSDPKHKLLVPDGGVKFMLFGHAVAQGNAGVADSFNTSSEDEKMSTTPWTRSAFASLTLLSHECDSKQDHFAFDEHHRFKQLQATTIWGRLHLAALYAATSTLMPEPRQSMTGFENAMSLVRRSVVDRPLNEDEKETLGNVMHLAPLAPGLAIACHLMWKRSRQLLFLYPDAPEAEKTQDRPQEEECVAFDDRLLVAYRSQVEAGLVNPRLQLSNAEARLVFGHSAPRARQHRVVLQAEEPGDRRAHAVDSLVQEISQDEETLKQLTCEAKKVKKSKKKGRSANLLDKCKLPSTEMAETHVSNLEQSCKLHAKSKQYTLAAPAPQIKADVKGMLDKLCTRKHRIEKSLRATLSISAKAANKRECLHQWRAFNAGRCANLAPLMTMRDLVVLCANAHEHDVEFLLDMNPFLTRSECSKVKAATVMWMQLCVLEDRLRRILAYLEQLLSTDIDATEKKGIETLLVQELRCKRTWDAKAHPYWLAFEVDGGIQIRPKQYRVAKEMMDGSKRNKGVIMQLNMGEGKTRVIVPMLLLHQSLQNRQTRSADSAGHVPRVFFLPQLEHQAFEDLHRYLCAGAISYRLLRLPFHRHMQVTPENLGVLCSVLETAARTEPFAVVTTPSAYLSLQLKKDELQLCPSAATRAFNDVYPGGSSERSGGTGSTGRQISRGDEDQQRFVEKSVAGLTRVLHGLPYVHIYDESDEILRHTFQLIYAAGDSTPLPDAQHRVRVTQALLRVLHNCKEVSTPFNQPTEAAQASPSKAAKTKGKVKVKKGGMPKAADFERGSQRQPTARQHVFCETAHQNVLSWHSSGCAGGWNALQLISGKSLTKALPVMHKEVVRRLLDNPPEELDWMRELTHHERACVIAFATTAEMGWEQFLARFSQPPKPKQKRQGRPDEASGTSSNVKKTFAMAAQRQHHAPKLHGRTPSESREALVPDDATDADTTEVPTDDTRQEWIQHHKLDILALRGLLSTGKLFATLQKRHRVHFGIAERRNKRVAVPFRANDTPSERAEFVDIETNVCLTHISFLQRGLQEHELREAVKKLLELPQPQRELHYNRWFAGSKSKMEEEDAKHAKHARNTKHAEDAKDAENATYSKHVQLLDRESKLDLSSAEQWQLLRKYYSGNMETVFFWVNAVVMQEDMRQYPSRLTKTPWSITDTDREWPAHDSPPSDRVHRQCGFSGTNDNNMLLPSHVAPLDLSHSTSLDEHLREVAATNGKMVSCLLSDVVGIEVVSGNPDVDMWEAVLDQALELKVDAIIDAGALLAGVNNNHVVDKLLEKLQEKQLQGTAVPTAVAYSERGDQEGVAWYLKSCHGEKWPRASAPIRERDALVLFDQHQCRGADLKLKQTATAALTISPGLSKDALMQAAGRLRQLGRGQKIVLLLSKQAEQLVRESQLGAQGNASSGAAKKGSSQSIETAHVLQWIVSNTIAASQNHLTLWAAQGTAFGATKRVPNLTKQPEKLGLEVLYECARIAEPTAKLMQKLRADIVGDAATETVADEGSDPIFTQILDLCEVFGVREVEAGAADQECERELERVREQEQEKQSEKPQAISTIEEPWKFECVLRQPDPSVHVLGFLTLQSILDERLQTIAWADVGVPIYCTCNYARPSVRSAWYRRLDGDEAPLPPELLPVDMLLVYPNKRGVVILTQYDAEHLVRIYQAEELWGAVDPKVGASARHKRHYTEVPALIHLSQLQMSENEAVPGVLSLNIQTEPADRERYALPIAAVAALRLLNGDTQFNGIDGKPHEGMKKEVDEILLPTAESRKHALLLPQLHQLSHTIDQSELERICKRMPRTAE
ncbi:hypothetical protein PTSG_04309 [Salpingoeca rosetta]|uniref:ubiquitinyl hydrolase 1 n=1 Tax=Salpingoeca rosetta (strain ATCC 50818 / BSB-021) TaxID=946362 RepID=F2U865_SALR5|nr:uncharacterized protein PTSG_04309 [Salpingoeca rosetta]EGD72573.1 hypothetical protein PTSG_04309 [Salpingoeca rosetta]|eukprot:XP_004994396.1 hypothetical protein PTSG_04309 [Salpingoeca rosetta]